VIPYTGDGSYVAKRLVNYPIGAAGFAHATLLTMPPETKVLSHWHDDREAVFYCVRGEGLFVLDDVERTATPGTAMLQPVHAIHGFLAGGEEFHFLDFALLSDVAVLRAGSILYLIADLPFAVTGRLRTVCASSVAGRIPEPPLFARLRDR